METRDYAAIAKQYARDVVSGKQPAGKSIRLQCERFLHELTRHRRKDFPYTFDPKKAAKVCAFVECLPHTKGKWASQRARLVLEPWQIWILALTFGWLHKGTKLRRFRRLLLVVPRKNGKSALAAGIGLYMLCLDGEAGAEVYSGATTEKQAKEVFTPARLMALRTPQLTSAFGIEVLAKALIKPADASKFEMITGDPGDGQSPSCAITDEYHEHDDDRQVDTMLTGMGARDQPLQVIVTTAGYKLDGPCYAEILECRERLAGIGHNGGPPLDDDMLFVEYAADEEDDWRSENTLRKANPNYGVSVGEEYLQSRLRDAIRSPRKAAIYKTKHLNLWVAAKAAWFDVEHWRKCTRDTIAQRSSEALTDADLQGRRCIIAGDLATKIDIAALEYLFLPIGGKPTPDDPYIRIGRYFLPSDRIEDVPAYHRLRGNRRCFARRGVAVRYRSCRNGSMAGGADDPAYAVRRPADGRVSDDGAEFLRTDERARCVDARAADRSRRLPCDGMADQQRHRPARQERQRLSEQAARGSEDRQSGRANDGDRRRDGR